MNTLYIYIYIYIFDMYIQIYASISVNMKMKYPYVRMYTYVHIYTYVYVRSTTYFGRFGARGSSSGGWPNHAIHTSLQVQGGARTRSTCKSVTSTPKSVSLRVQVADIIKEGSGVLCKELSGFRASCMCTFRCLQVRETCTQRADTNNMYV